MNTVAKTDKLMNIFHGLVRITKDVFGKWLILVTTR